MRRIFDIHLHIGAVSIGSEGAGEWTPEGDFTARRAIMTRFGITNGAISPHVQFEKPNGFKDTQSINDRVAAYRDNYREQFPIAFGAVDPLQGVDNGVAEIRRLALDLRLNGVVWHHRLQGVWIADPRMFRFLDALREFGLPAIIHCWGESTMEAPWGLERLAGMFPDLTFFAFDAFSSFTQAQTMMLLAEKHENIIFDVSCVVPLGRIIEQWVAKYGADRLVFGTDMSIQPQLYHFPHVLTEILEAPGLTDADRDRILWGNAARIFRLEQGSRPTRTIDHLNPQMRQGGA
jgi:predicted TIM-barrel fold metal-dependent hydrolase